MRKKLGVQGVFGAGNGDRTRDPRLGKAKKPIFLTLRNLAGFLLTI